LGLIFKSAPKKKVTGNKNYQTYTPGLKTKGVKKVEEVKPKKEEGLEPTTNTVETNPEENEALTGVNLVAEIENILEKSDDEVIAEYGNLKAVKEFARSLELDLEYKNRTAKFMAELRDELNDIDLDALSQS